MDTLKKRFQFRKSRKILLFLFGSSKLDTPSNYIENSNIVRKREIKSRNVFFFKRKLVSGAFRIILDEPH